MHINVHLPWWITEGRKPGTFRKGAKLYRKLENELSRRENITLTVSGRPWRAQAIGENSFCLNYHQSYVMPRNLNIRQAYLPNFFYLDRRGYSGWSEIAKAEFKPELIDRMRAKRYYRKHLWDPYFSKGRSKYNQIEATQDLPNTFTFVPLQVPTDHVLELAYFSQNDMLDEVIKCSPDPVVIKIHPMSAREHPEHIKEIQKRHDPDNGVYVVDGHVHSLIRAARVVVCTNSGAGMEAILLNTAVVTCGAADYHHLTTVVQNTADLSKAILNAKAPRKGIMHRYAKWFFGEMLINADERPRVLVNKVIQRLKT